MSALPDATQATRFGSGRAVRRVEDPALVQGQGRFTDDVQPTGQLYIRFVRSPYAHGRITSTDTATARAMPGVVAVYTGADLVAAGVKAMPGPSGFPRSGGRSGTSAPRRALAHERVRFVGETVAMVVAETVTANGRYPTRAALRLTPSAAESR